jgi:ubiquitin C-terminal hydrolase
MVQLVQHLRTLNFFQIVSTSNKPSTFSYIGPEILYEYDLFGVICHEGQIDNGHYISYARFGDEVLVPFLIFDRKCCSNSMQWYRFDDDKYVLKRSLSLVNYLILKQSYPYKSGNMSECICVYVFLCQTAP